MTELIIGHNKSVEPFLSQLKRGRFPHAWLFEGPKGVGKATLARLLAATVLGDSYSADNNGFKLTSSEAYKKIEASNHPDVRIVSDEREEGDTRSSQISVDEIRKLTGFFELQASQGGYRVGIVDSLDSLNANGANALLKTLEEPPEKCLLILIYHGSTSILPTIRSRCVRLKFSALPRDDLQAAIRAFETEAPASEDVLALSGGSPGRLRTYLDCDADILISELKTSIFNSWPEVSSSRWPKLKRLMSISELHLELGVAAISHWLGQMARSETASLENSRYARLWSELNASAERGKALKLDKSERAAAHLQMLIRLSDEMRVRA